MSTPENVEPLIGPCYRCDEPGHLAENCPEMQPAKDYAEHKRRIDLYNARYWETGKWDLTQKRNAISRENEMWYGSNAGPLRTNRRK